MLIKFNNKWFGPSEFTTIVKNPDGTVKLGRSGRLYDKGVVELPEDLFDVLPRDNKGEPKYGMWERLDKEPEIVPEEELVVPFTVEEMAAKELQRAFDAQHEKPKLTPAQERMAKVRAARKK